MRLSLCMPFLEWPPRASMSRAIANPNRNRFFPFIARLGSVIQRAWEIFPMTPLGMSVLGSLVIAIKYVGEPHNDRIIRVGAIAVSIVFATCLFSVLAIALWLRWRPYAVNSSKLECVAETPKRLDRSSRWLKWLPMIKVEQYLDAPLNGRIVLSKDNQLEYEEFLARERGSSDFMPKRFVVSDLLGLCRCIVHRHLQQSIMVKPFAGPAVPLAFAAITEGGDQIPDASGMPQGDMIETRRYSHGDSLKFVLWKVYARTGQLLVRTPERTNSSSRKILAYFVAGNQDEASAGVACSCFEHHVLGDQFTFTADGAVHPVCTVNAAIEQIIDSRTARNAGGAGLASFLRLGVQQRIQNCVVFIPAQSGAWLDRVVAALSSYTGKCHFVMGVDSADDPGQAPISLARRILFVSHPLQTDERDLIAQKLMHAGAQVSIIDRRTGIVLPSSRV